MAWWTEDKHELVKQGLRDGRSTGQIAKQLSLSRNAVIGRIHRNPDLAELLPPKQRLAQQNKLAAYTSQRRPAAAVPDTPAPPVSSTAPALPPLPMPPEPAMRLVPLDLVGSACRFPVAEDHHVNGNFLFCGAKVAYDGASYCVYHHALCVTGRLGRAH